jgi:drug/metabolite transporter (DMT)-like permease
MAAGQSAARLRRPFMSREFVTPIIPYESPEAPRETARPIPFSAVAILMGVTVIWGTTFVATRLLVAGDKPALAPGALIFWRFLLAAVIFLPALRGSLREPGLWRAGLELSFWLWAGYATQAIGLVYTTASRSAFVTSLNVIFVPVFIALGGKRVSWVIWAAAGAALGGAALLSYDGGSPNIGDIWTLGCAITYALYILRLEHFAGRFRSMPLTAVQLWGVAALSSVWAGGEVAAGAGWGNWSLPVIGDIVFLGIIATALTTWLQAIGQRGVPGTHASLLYTLEPVFASAFAYMVFGERLGGQGLAGAALILLAAIASQVVPMLMRRK